MQFRKLSMGDIDTVAPFFEKLETRTCDYTVGGMFMWRDFYRMEYCVEDGTFYSRLFDDKGLPHYNLPIGGDMIKGIDRIVAFEKQFRPVVRFCTVPEEYLPCFEHETRLSETAEQDAYFDYLYSATDLIQLSGKKYSGQRNQISQFRRANENWHFEDLTGANLADVVAFFTQTYHEDEQASVVEKEENAKVLEVLGHMDAYRMTGGVLYVGEEIVGFSLGERLRDTLFTHIEKADRSRKGAYQMLVNQFTQRCAGDGIAYVNREEDMGDPGLRTAKQAYHPVALLKKYAVEVS